MLKVNAALKLAITAVIFAFLVSTLFIQPASAQTSEDEDPVLFVIGEGSTYLGETG